MKFTSSNLQTPKVLYWSSEGDMNLCIQGKMTHPVQNIYRVIVRKQARVSSRDQFTTEKEWQQEKAFT